jgi:hypothetical protein
VHDRLEKMKRAYVFITLFDVVAIALYNWYSMREAEDFIAKSKRVGRDLAKKQQKVT